MSLLDDKAVIILSGFPATGKTTYRNFLVNTFFKKGKIFCFSLDDEIEKKAKEMNKTYNDVFSFVVKGASTNIEKKLKETINEYDTFIFDQTNLTSKKFGKIKSYFDGCDNVSFVTLFFAPPANDHEFDVYINRLKSRKGKDINVKTISDMAGFYDEDIINQNGVSFLTNYNCDDTVKSISKNEYEKAINYFLKKIKEY